MAAVVLASSGPRKSAEQLTRPQKWRAILSRALGAGSVAQCGPAGGSRRPCRYVISTIAVIHIVLLNRIPARWAASTASSDASGRGPACSPQTPSARVLLLPATVQTTWTGMPNEASRNPRDAAKQATGSWQTSSPFSVSIDQSRSTKPHVHQCPVAPKTELLLNYSHRLMWNDRRIVALLFNSANWLIWC